MQCEAGDRIIIETPGAGGFGAPGSETNGGVKRQREEDGAADGSSKQRSAAVVQKGSVYEYQRLQETA